MTTFTGLEWNQSSDTWTALDQDDFVSADYVAWNQSTDTWMGGDLLTVFDGADLSGSGSLVAAEPIIYMVTTVDLSGTGALAATATLWTPSTDRTFTTPDEDRTFTTPDEDRTFTAPAG